MSKRPTAGVEGELIDTGSLNPSPSPLRPALKLSIDEELNDAAFFPLLDDKKVKKLFFLVKEPELMWQANGRFPMTH